MAQKHIIVLVTLTVLLAVFPLFQGKFYAAGDTSDVFIPLETFFRQEMLAGRLPAWHPDAAWGFPVIASAQIGFFYPPLLLTRWLPIWFYLPLNLAAHLVALAIGTFYFLKKLERSNGAAFLGAISFTLGAFIFEHLTHLNIIFAIAWFPWQLIVAKRLGERRPTNSDNLGARVGRQNFVGLEASIALFALLLAIPFLAGQVQVPLLMALVSSMYYLILAPLKRQAALRLGTAATLAIGLTAAQLLPTAELAWNSTRGRNNDFAIERANQYSWPVYHLPTLLFPRFFGSSETYWGKRLQLEYGFFIGTFPLLLALSVLFRSKLVIGHWSLGFWRWLTIITFLLALGSLSPFRLLHIEPSLWLFSAPARWLLFTTFGLSTLAAYGWDNIREIKFPLRQVSFAVVACVVLANLLLFAIPRESLNAFLSRTLDMARQASPEIFAKPQEYYTTKADSLINSLRTSGVSLRSPYTLPPLVLLLAAPFLIQRNSGRRFLLAAAAAELILLATTANPAFSWKEILRRPPTVAELPDAVTRRQARLYTLRGFEDVGLMFTNPENRPFDRLYNEPRRLLLPLIHTQFGLPGVVWPASLDLASQAEVLGRLNDELEQGETKLARDLNIGAILSPSPHLQVLPAEPRASLLGENGAETSAEYKEITPSHIEIKVESPEAATLIVRDTFYPGWNAFADGEEIPIAQDGIFRAISLPAGNHLITMQYQPILLYIGIGTSTTTLLFLLGLAFLRLSSHNAVQKRNHASHPLA